ncbi:hypothetical protein CEUSTIGMA_g5114.t1 [Chlamydomonas eustigma]|uniref:Purple acid phosphatase C-terminal domain-containing protein n=1 Tax=Chlamydomonas eustigma TaxID=1157962 RepID=A0A250X3N8_9CHLO|nr:hypothetical protein CEUSTIGMA_g5114.t1 [Chlamydomonas eustigma]|eukprot:GAX77671.1 hypothetical protein CEUSTIGMA_g5114.t1 [Chlamydomonas eustigma]
MECFASVYEDLFFQSGVDLILNGHVHAYERTHPMYQYSRNECGPVHVVIGDGGNIEGPYRNFVDQINIYDPLNRTYCELLKYKGHGPNEHAAEGKKWGPPYQTQCQPPSCPTLSWQPSSGVTLGAPPLVLKTNSSTLGFCQSSQPLWSAHRDPSFGHGILDVISDREISLAWYRNVDGEAVVADRAVIKRKRGLAAKDGQHRCP